MPRTAQRLPPTSGRRTRKPPQTQPWPTEPPEAGEAEEGTWPTSAPERGDEAVAAGAAAAGASEPEWPSEGQPKTRRRHRPPRSRPRPTSRRGRPRARRPGQRPRMRRRNRDGAAARRGGGLSGRGRGIGRRDGRGRPDRPGCRGGDRREHPVPALRDREPARARLLPQLRAAARGGRRGHDCRAARDAGRDDGLPALRDAQPRRCGVLPELRRKPARDRARLRPAGGGRAAPRPSRLRSRPAAPCSARSC